MVCDAGTILCLHAGRSIGGIHVAEPSRHDLAGGVAAIRINIIPIITLLSKYLAVSAIRHAECGCSVIIVLRDAYAGEIGGAGPTEIGRGVADITVFACGDEGGIETAGEVETDPVD